MASKNSHVPIILAIVLAVAVVTVVVVTYTMKQSPRQVACTQEAMVCPDGTSVGRTGPNCEFTPCSTTAPVPLPVDCSGADGACPGGYTCIQRCGPPVARENDPAPGYYCELSSVASQPRMCPICLASNALIATPDGEIGVRDVVVGTIVWSTDANGNKVASPVVAVSHTPVPASHQVTDLVLSDGRELWVSPNHPSATGVPIGSLRAGDSFDGAIVQSVESVTYWDTDTYDLLPDTSTGTYWANGILLGSTLVSSR